MSMIAFLGCMSCVNHLLAIKTEYNSYTLQTFFILLLCVMAYIIDFGIGFYMQQI